MNLSYLVLCWGWYAVKHLVVVVNSFNSLVALLLPPVSVFLTSSDMSIERLGEREIGAAIPPV